MGGYHMLKEKYIFITLKLTTKTIHTNIEVIDHHD